MDSRGSELHQFVKDLFQGSASMAACAALCSKSLAEASQRAHARTISTTVHICNATCTEVCTRKLMSSMAYISRQGWWHLVSS